MTLLLPFHLRPRAVAALFLACACVVPSVSEARTRKKVRRKVRISAPTRTTSLPAPPSKQTVFRGEAEEMKARLIVPSIYLDALIMRGIDDGALRLGPGHDSESDEPGEPGNCVVAAHRNVWGAEFWHLPSVKVGDAVEVRTPEHRLIYRVKWARNVRGDDMAPLQPPSNPGVSRLTLYTCTKPRTSSRFVVSADLEQRLPSSPEMFKPQTLPFPPYHTPTLR